MGDLLAAISRAADGGNPDRLYAAVKRLPKRPGRVDPRSNDDAGPIPGESFDDVTAAWTAGRLSDDVYTAAIQAASTP